MLRILFKFINDSVEEIKRVQWPDKNTTVRLTLYVIGASLCVGIFVSVFDYGFKEILKSIILK